jgi:DNA-binding NtrC family response regulator
LGLSVVHGIVAAHLGSITVDSVLGEGSIFHVHLPATSEPLALPAVHERAALVAAHGEHVVYLDDDETVMLVMVRILERAGYRCSGFLDASAALASIKDAPAGVDVFITDYNMPGRSGLDVAREAISMNPDLPIAISTGLMTDELCERARALGVFAVIEKENAFREIVPLVRRILEKSKR